MGRVSRAQKGLGHCLVRLFDEGKVGGERFQGLMQDEEIMHQGIGMVDEHWVADNKGTMWLMQV